MGWNHRIGAFERIVEATAAASLGAAGAMAIAGLAPLAGVTLWAAAAACAIAAAVGALVVLRRFDERNSGPSFALVDFADIVELLLDEPIAPPECETRVVRLFGARPLPHPAEKMARIGEYLEADRNDRAVPSASVGASAALHAALADIRRTLA